MNVRIGHAQIDCMTFDEAVMHICSLATEDERGRYVVTANIQHIVELERNSEFREAYDAASLVLPDGWPVARTAGMLRGLPQPRVAGSDLVPAVCRAAAAKGLSVGFMGGQPGAAATAGELLTKTVPGLSVVLVEEAPAGFDATPDGLDRVLARVADAAPDVLFLAFGAPKQEIFCHRHRLPAGITLWVGAGVDFVAGARRRAPERWQQLGLEWLYRSVEEPRRLLPRYARAAPRFAAIVARDWKARDGR